MLDICEKLLSGCFCEYENLSVKNAIKEKALIYGQKEMSPNNIFYTYPF